MNKSQKFAIISIVFFLISTIISQVVYAELYQDYDGKLITEEEYLQRVNICIEKQQSDDCLTWALTDTAEALWNFKYKIQQPGKESLSNLIQKYLR